METGHENFVDVVDYSARYYMMLKGKKFVECVSKWCHLSMLKHTDSYRARVYKNVSRFFFSSYLVAKRGSWSQAFLA